MSEIADSLCATWGPDKTYWHELLNVLDERTHKSKVFLLTQRKPGHLAPALVAPPL